MVLAELRIFGRGPRAFTVSGSCRSAGTGR